MIKTKNGKVDLKGIGPELLADYSTITKPLIEAIGKFEGSEEFGRQAVEHAYKLGTMSEEEIRKEAKEKVAKLLSELVEKLNEDKEEKADE